jgi:acyl carrier protein
MGLRAGDGRVTRAEVRDRISSLIHEIAAVPRERITDQATVDNELQMQSVAFVELQVAIEDEYEIQIDPIQIVELNEFGAIVDYVYNCAVGSTP